MTTALAPNLTDIPTINEADVCHVILEDSTATACGAPSHGSCFGEEWWAGQVTCRECKRRVCPECSALARGAR